MSSCASRRWGPGTACEKTIDTPGARELEAKMKVMMLEREKQANFWGSTPTPLESRPFCEFNVNNNASDYAKEPRKCDLNRSSNISNIKNTTSNSSSQQIRFWN